MIKLEIHLDNRNSTTTKLTHTFAFAVWSKRVETQNEGMIINFNVYGPQTRNFRLCVAELNFGRVWLGAWVEHKEKGNARRDSFGPLIGTMTATKIWVGESNVRDR